MNWFDLAGNIASIAGLIVSAFALHAASTAADAAKKARAEIRRANAVELLNHMREIGGQLKACVENRQLQEAVVRCRDLIAELSRARARWDRFMLEETKTAIDETRAQVHVISRSLSVYGIPTTAREKIKLLNYCNFVATVLSEESGRIIAAIEREQE